MRKKKEIRAILKEVVAVFLSTALLAGCAGPTFSSEAVSQTAGEDTNTSGADGSVSGNETADGTYTDVSFTFSGGSGKVTITCPEVAVTDGEAVAELMFSSPHYEYVKVNDTQYDREEGDDADASYFHIPVTLGETMTITAMTTAMSTPHEIDYEITVSLGGESGASSSAAASESVADTEYDASFDPENVAGLTYEGQMELKYAETFDVYYYADDYRIIDVHDSARYLIVPDGKTAPDGVPDTLTVLTQPLDTVYLAATSVMALYNAIGALGDVKYTGTDADGWYIDAPKDALESGAMTYAGKYSAPDYEMLVGGGCDLAIESTMILHAPEVKEMLESLGIPVFIDTSSRESHPLGRTEWVKLYGVLAGRESEADAFFSGEEAKIEALGSTQDTGKTVAFFAVSSDGTVVVRTSDDYIPRMIEIAGGEYIFKDLVNTNSDGTTMQLSMEEFYSGAKDADYLIYNSTIETPLSSVNDLIAKDSLFADFRAVQNGNVWQVEKSLYQSTDIVGELITDLNGMLNGKDPSSMQFLEKLD